MAFQRPDARRPRRDGGSERPSFNPNFSAGGGDRDRGSDRDRRPSGPRTPGGRPPQGGGGGFRPGGGGSDNRRDDRGGSSDRGGSRPNTGPGGFGGGSGRSFSKPGSDRFSGPERGGFKGPRGGNDRDSDRPRSYGPPRDDRFNAPRSFGPPRSDDRDRARFDDSAPDNRPLRPARDVRPSGLPMRNSEGRAVPHGQTGERNRKFVKPQAPNDPRPVTPARFQDRMGSRPGNDDRDRDRDQRPGRFEADRPRPYSPPRDGGARPGKHDARANGNRGFGSDRRKPEERNYDNRVREERRMAGGWQPERIFQQQQQQQENRPGRGGHPQNVDFERGADAPRRMAGSERGPRSWADRRFGSADRSSQFEAPTYNLKKFSNDRGGAKAKKRASGDDYSEPKEGIRLNRYIANAGVCSRREADALIAAGEIRINGEIVMEMGYIVKPEDSVQYGKRSLKREKLVYVLLNKPKDHITTTDDPEERKTVMDLVGNASKERIFPVGRLDRNTTGLLLFTNDGELAQKLTHPSHRMQKIYQVELDKALSADHFAQIREGLMLEDGKIEIDDLAVVAGNERFVGIELHSGRNRIVRRIFEHLGYDVVTLDRVQYAGLTKKDLPRGNWRYLTQQEVVRLKFMQ